MPNEKEPAQNPEQSSRISVICKKCGAKFSASRRAEGQKLKCLKCESAILIAESGPPATQKQKEFAKDLGIEFNESVSKAEMTRLITAALAQADEDQRLQLAALDAREKAAAERKAKKAGTEGVNLATASPEQMVEEMAARGLAAFMVAIPWKNVRDDFKSLVGVPFSVYFSDEMSQEDVEDVIGAYASTILKRKGLL
jgi:DNA-directed RNA polymerase subunit RPC12/RpoP